MSLDGRVSPAKGKPLGARGLPIHQIPGPLNPLDGSGLPELRHTSILDTGHTARELREPK